MTVNLLNTDFPFVIEKNCQLSSNLSFLGSLVGEIPLHLTISRLKDDKYLLNGSLKALFINDCQSCLKETEVFIDIKIKVILLDSSEENSNENNFEDIHYQPLEAFSINYLIEEELLLSYPSIVFCQDIACQKKYNIKKREKNNPFKKLKDLL